MIPESLPTGMAGGAASTIAAAPKILGESCDASSSSLPRPRSPSRRAQPAPSCRHRTRRASQWAICITSCATSRPTRPSGSRSAAGPCSSTARRKASSSPTSSCCCAKASRAGGTQGSVVNHVAFRVKSVAAIERAGFEVEYNAQYPGVASVHTPEGERIELFDDELATNLGFTIDGGGSDATAERHNRKIEVPIIAHHIHLNVPQDQVAAAKEWYATHFGGVRGMRWRYDAVDLPGININISGVDSEPGSDARPHARSHRLRGRRTSRRSARSSKRPASSSTARTARCRRASASRS